MKLIHISDLHFGTDSPEIVAALHKALSALNADLVCISGDFTQIASKQEYRAARDFLDKLQTPAMCVPGNHDLPAYNVTERMLNPYRKYKRYIDQDLCPFFENDEIQIAGLNSARRALPHWNWANGKISGKQLQRLEEFFGDKDGRWRVCMFHHPVHKIAELPMDVTVFGRKATMQIIKDLKIDLVLTGHVHHAALTTIGDDEHQTVYLSASTALSSRLRHHQNGFNVIHLDDQNITVETITYDGSVFKTVQSYTHEKYV